MKKIFLTSIVMTFAAILSAATPTSWGNVVTVKLTDGNNDTYTSRFGTSPELTDAASWGAAVANFEGATVKAYVVLDGVNYEKLYLNSMVNVPLMVKTYEHATLTFNLKANYGTISLYDNVTKTITTVEKGSANETLDYVCTVPTNTTITNRFFLFYNASTFYYTVTTNADGWASFACADAVAPEAGLVAYKGAFDGVETLTLTTIAAIPAGEGAFLKGDAATEYKLYVADASAVDMSGNDIEGCVNATPVSTFSGKTIYTLRYANGATALWQYTGDAAIPAGKAVLPVSTGGGANPAPKHISLRVNGTQAVDNVEAAAPAEKFIENGQVLIKRGEVVYTLQGQVVK